jgi:hypothetical protein
MLRCIPFAVFLSAALFSVGAVAACPSPAKDKTHPAKPSKAAEKCIDLSAVPAISENIVAAEPAAPPPKNPAENAGTPAPYTGPTIGMASPGVKPAPTVGYKWSLQ